MPYVNIRVTDGNEEPTREHKTELVKGAKNCWSEFWTKTRQAR